MAESGLSNSATKVIAEAAELLVKLGANDPIALRARGLARVRMGDQSGFDDIERYIRWATGHGAASADLTEEKDAIAQFQDKQRL